LRNEIERRLAAAERRLTPGRGTLEVIVIRGGIHGGDPTFPNVGESQLDRAPDETFAAFQKRVVAAAMMIGQEMVIVGGLPDVLLE
jgi:hypothetical protein